MFTRTHGKITARTGQVTVAAALLAALLLAGRASGAQAARQTGFFAGLCRSVCRYNVALAEQAYQLFQLRLGRGPQDLAELLREGFTRPPRCPAGGALHLSADGTVTCSVHDRQALRVSQIGTHRAWPFTNQTPKANTFRRSDRAVYFLAAWEPDGRKHTVAVQWTDAEDRIIQIDRFAASTRADVAATLPLAERYAEQLPPGKYRATLMLDGETAGSTAFWLLR